MLETSRLLAALTELPPLVALVERSAERALDCERVHVFLENPYTEELVGHLSADAPPTRLAVGGTALGELFRQGACALVADPRLSEELAPPGPERARSLLVCPVPDSRGVALGILVAANRRRGRFEEWDATLLQALAAQAGAVIQRLRTTSSQTHRLEHDLDAARQILQALLPKHPPSVPGFEVAGWTLPADETGGDFYDFQDRPSGHLAIAVADVSGHGVGPAMVAAECRAFLRATLLHAEDPGVVIPQINRLLCESLPEDRFVTAFVGLLHGEEHRLAYVSAGHGPLLFFTRATAEFRELPIQGFPLGLSVEHGFGAPNSLEFAPGDFLAIITDGFFEWLGPDGECYGIDRLQNQLREFADRPAAEIIQGLYQAVQTFARGCPQLDDLAAVVIKRV